MSEKRIFKINLEPINPEEVEAHLKEILEKIRQAPKVENESTEKDTDPEETDFFITNKDIK